MPFRSERQRRYLHIHEPEMARRWEAEKNVGPQPKKKAAKKKAKSKAKKKP